MKKLKVKVKSSEVKDYYEEAKRYLANAEKLINDNITVNKHGVYSDSKYIKMAGETAYKAVLMSLTPLIGVRRGRKNVGLYQAALAKKNGKILDYFNIAYNYLHMFMGYDGDLSVHTKKTGFKMAKDIIEWSKNLKV